MMGVNNFFIKDYQAASLNYSLTDSIYAVSLLHNYDLKSKGIGSSATSNHDLLRELVYKLMHLNEVEV